MPFLIPRRPSPGPEPMADSNEKAREGPPSRSPSRKDKLRISLIHLSRYFSRPKSAFSAPSLVSSVSSRTSDDSGRSYPYSLDGNNPSKGGKGEKVILGKTSTPEGFLVISKKHVHPTAIPSLALGGRPAGVTRTLSNASRRGQPIPPPTLAQIAALKIYAEKALPPLPKPRPTSAVLLSVTPPTDSAPSAYLLRQSPSSPNSRLQVLPPKAKAPKPPSAPSAFPRSPPPTTPSKPRRTSLRPRTPKSPNNTDSFLSLSSTPPRRYSFRAFTSSPTKAGRTSFLNLSPSPSPSPKKKAAYMYSTTSQRMGLVNGAVLPPGQVELRAAALPVVGAGTVRMYRHPYATARC